MVDRGAVARALEAVQDFPDPQAELEQYLTPPDVASHICHRAALSGDLAETTVVDLGTGTGMLALCAALYEPTRVVGLEVDRDALAVAQANERRLDPPTAVEWVQGAVGSSPLSTVEATVLANPPFGAQLGNRGADRAFLAAASTIGRVSYTIHNEGSRATIEAIADEYGGTVTHAFATELAIDHRFAFHTEQRHEQAAEVFRIEWTADQVDSVAT